jgi:GPH family glycoside/pentoside/hexuronide:cation symporter
MQNTAPRLSKLTKIFYGAGDFGFSTTNSILGILFAIFLTDIVGLSPAQAALAIFIGRSWDYINDPLIGYLSDRTRSRWGRRRPFLLFGAIPFAITFILMWVIPPFQETWMLVGYYALVYLLYDSSATFVYMPYYALTPDLSEDYDERTSLTSYRMGFNILGSLVAFVVPLMIIGKMIPENHSRVLLMAVIFGVAIALPLFGTFLVTHEKMDHVQQSPPRLLDSIKAAFKNRPFLYTAGIFLFTFAALEIIQTMMLYFIKYRLLMEDQSELIAATVFVTAMLTLPFWSWVSNKRDKRIAYIYGMAFFSVIIINLVLVDPSWGLVPVLVISALAGLGVGAVQVLPWSMIPDTVEVDELSTGARHEGMFYSLVLLLRKISQSIALPLVLLVMDWSGYIANAPIQTSSASRAIQWLMGPVPSVFLLIGVVFALKYPLTRAVYQKTIDGLAKRAKPSIPGLNRTSESV